MSQQDGGSWIRGTISEQMASRFRRRRPPVVDVIRNPPPDAKPHANAQWDEAAGRWVVWSDVADGWVSLEDGSVQDPGTPSVEPPRDALPPGRLARRPDEDRAHTDKQVKRPRFRRIRVRELPW